MYDRPPVDEQEIVGCLLEHYGLQVSELEVLNGGYDFRAFTCSISAQNGNRYFLKGRLDPIRQATLRVPFELDKLGVRSLLPPIETLEGRLSCPCGSRFLILYPHMDGENAKSSPLSADQWMEFGQTMNAIHSTSLPPESLDGIRIDDFSLPIGKTIDDLFEKCGDKPPMSDAQTLFREVWNANATKIRDVLSGARTLAHKLKSEDHQKVICHSDCHLWNVLVADSGNIYLIDWDDGPVFAPRERDLILILNKYTGASTKEQEELFMAGYGNTAVHPVMLDYYRKERWLEDVGVSGGLIFFDQELNEDAKIGIARDVQAFFQT